MSALGHLGALLIRIFGIALATGAVTGGYFLGKRYLDKTLALFSEGRYEAVRDHSGNRSAYFACANPLSRIPETVELG